MKRVINISVYASLILAIFLVSISMAQRPGPKRTMVKGHTMFTVLKPGEIPAIFEPEFISVSKAQPYYFQTEPLLVVVGESTVKGYSTWHLDQHEIVNDEIDGVKIAATW